MDSVDPDADVNDLEERIKRRWYRSGWFRALSREHQIELITVVLLSLAALASAWCGYQASQWNGEQASHFFVASGLRAEATHLRTTATLQANLDAGMLRDWEAAYIDDDQARMDFYWNRFSDELVVAMEEWLRLDPLNNPEAPPSPLAMPSYRIAEAERADQLDDEADRNVIAGENANNRSGDYVFNTVIFATVLLFAGLTTTVDSIVSRSFTLTLSAVFLLLGTIQLFLIPTLF